MPRSRRSVAAFLTGLVIGGAIWWLSPLITGSHEPWDAEGVYYAGSLLGAGLLGGLLLPGHWRWFVVGVFVGQVLVLLAGVLRDPSTGGLWPLGLIFLALYSVLTLLGAALGTGLRRLGNRRTS